MIILIHTSKTMRPAEPSQARLRIPQYIDQAESLANHLRTLSADQLSKIMKISLPLALSTEALIKSWSKESTYQRSAIDSFLGDIYSGLQVAGMTREDLAYADAHLLIISGLYGILKPLDGIYPYRLEMGYKLPLPNFSNLYCYWGRRIAEAIPVQPVVINLAAVEYMKAISPYIDRSRVITPSFLSISPKTGLPTFVTVHAKIARGAFASWLIRNRIEDARELHSFHGLGYSYQEELSTTLGPVFVCRRFEGLGLSVRLI
jgi:cytoplasmic iron level regulating protein YaaA (DUF328/UPF0246 family)